MPNDEPNDDKEALIQAYVEGALTPEESAKLREMIRRDPVLARVLMENLRMDGAIREIVAERDQGLAAAPAPAERPRTRASRRIRFLRAKGLGRFNVDRPLLPFVGVLAAAALLIAIAVAVQTGRKPNGVAPHEPEVAVEPPLRVEDAQRLAEERVRELEERRKRFVRPATEPAIDPAGEEKRRKELAQVDKEIKRAVSEWTDAVIRAEFVEPTPAPPPPFDPAQGKPPAPAPAPEKPAPATVPAIAKVVPAEGHVYLLAGGNRTLLTAPCDLLPGQGVETSGVAGRAILTFVDDSTRVELAPQTLFGQVAAEGGKRVSVERGSLRAFVAKQPKGRPMVFATPHGEATVLGTSLRIMVDLDANRGTRLEVTEGRVSLKRKSDGKAVDVSGGHYAVSAVGVELVPQRLPRSKAEQQLETHGVVAINFGPDNVVNYLPERILNDSGKPFDASLGYGWKTAHPPAGSPEEREGKGHRPGVWDPAKLKTYPLLASFVFAGSSTHTETWGMTVPNGRYLVTVSVGTYVYDQGPHHIKIEGKQVVDKQWTERGTFHERKDVPIEVSDGELTMILGGHGTNQTGRDLSDDTVINYLVVRRRK